MVELDEADYAQRKWVMGVTGGELESAPVFTIFSGYSFTENLAAEVHLGQSISSSLITENDDTSTFAQVGIGIQGFVSRNFLFRFELNEYVIFSTTSTSDNNEEVSEWKFGFAVFY